MHKEWRQRIAVIAFVFGAYSANAQSCEQMELDGFEDRSVTERLNTQRSCILEQQRRLNSLANSLEGLSDRALGNSSAIDLWEKERFPIVEAAAGQQQTIDAIQLILGDSVLAFDRSQRTGACPRGWSLFEPAGGRMIIGAGRHSNGHTEYPAFADAPSRAVGGSEKVSLSGEHIPSHTHNIPQHGHRHDDWAFGTSDSGGWTLQGGTQRFNIKRSERGASNENLVASSFGGSQPHNNMPPYISLYFCKKD